uniref:Peptidase S1 domain-containing protein n=1 Tax=Trichuris muris TaxID=70415 RepID=A0A5S6R3J0_TRIMR
MRLKHWPLIVVVHLAHMLLAKQKVCGDKEQYEKVAAAFAEHQSAVVGAFPWSVVVFEDKLLRCFGNLLVTPNVKNANATNLILTANGCSSSSKGERDGYLEKLAVRIAVEEHEKNRTRTPLTILHAAQFLANGQPDDVGIFKLSSPVIFDDKIKPICLPDAASKPAELTNCFFSSYDFDQRYVINKVRECGERKRNDHRTPEICYVTATVLPPKVYGSAIVCSHNGLPVASAVIGKIQTNRRPSVKNEKRAIASVVTGMPNLNTYVQSEISVSVDGDTEKPSAKEVSAKSPSAKALPSVANKTIQSFNLNATQHFKTVNLQSFNQRKRTKCRQTGKPTRCN